MSAPPVVPRRRSVRLVLPARPPTPPTESEEDEEGDEDEDAEEEEEDENEDEDEDAEEQEESEAEEPDDIAPPTVLGKRRRASTNKPKPKPDTYKVMWSASEQNLLERLLEEIPPSDPRRYLKISIAMEGRRTPRQVSSRVQKYLLKLRRFGVGV
ncbi:hypothetical protein K438DRAFT_1813394 [Mycena galopus ATCC 62051]|nr:hypothetical protein K438DRAFT_1813394 [Mycena galopus ATCC 62051]